MAADPETEICVTCGATEAMAATVIGIADPGDEVVVFEPFYENYGADAIIAGAVPRYVTLHEPDWAFDEAELAAAFSDRTRIIILNNPGNPTGKVFSRRGAGGDQPALPEARRDRGLGRDLRAHHLRRGPAHPDRHGARPGEPLGDHQRPVQELLGDRMAGGLDDRPARADRRDPEGARLPHRGRARAAAGGRRGRGAAARRLLRAARGRLRRAPRADARDTRARPG